MTIGANDAVQLDFMLSQVGVVVSFGAMTVNGNFHTSPVKVLTPEGVTVPIYERELRIRPGTLGAVKTGSTIYISGAPYIVRDIFEAEDDGLVPHIVVTA